MTEKCGALGALTVGGRVVGQLRCELDAGHDVGYNDVCYCGASMDDHNDPTHRPTPGPGVTPHAVTLTWTPEAAPDLNLFDADESFDVDVPLDETWEGIFRRAAGPKRAPMYGSSDDDGI